MSDSACPSRGELKVDAMGKDKRTVRISVTDLVRIEVAAELVRRGPVAL
jgi:hypothetical protein